MICDLDRVFVSFFSSSSCFQWEEYFVVVVSWIGCFLNNFFNMLQETKPNRGIRQTWCVRVSMTSIKKYRMLQSATTVLMHTFFTASNPLKRMYQKFVDLSKELLKMPLSNYHLIHRTLSNLLMS